MRVRKRRPAASCSLARVWSFTTWNLRPGKTLVNGRDGFSREATKDLRTVTPGAGEVRCSRFLHEEDSPMRRRVFGQSLHPFLLEISSPSRCGCFWGLTDLSGTVVEEFALSEI